MEGPVTGKSSLTEDITLKIDCVDDNAVIMADKTQMDQVLMNLEPCHKCAGCHAQRRNACH